MYKHISLVCPRCQSLYLNFNNSFPYNLSLKGKYINTSSCLQFKSVQSNQWQTQSTSTWKYLQQSIICTIWFLFVPPVWILWPCVCLIQPPSISSSVFKEKFYFLKYKVNHFTFKHPQHITHPNLSTCFYLFQKLTVMREMQISKFFFLLHFSNLTL